MQLTPVAIHEAMCFVETVFRGRPTKPDYDKVATAVFSQPEIGTVGLTEDSARERFRNLDIYKSGFRPLKGTLTGRSDRMLMKLVVDADTDIVLGAHVLGPGAGEMAQLLAIPVKLGATKADFDATMAVHPTAAEELVTFARADRAHPRRRNACAGSAAASTIFSSLAGRKRPRSLPASPPRDGRRRRGARPSRCGPPTARVRRRRAGGRRSFPRRRSSAHPLDLGEAASVSASSRDKPDHLLDEIAERHRLATAEIDQLAARRRGAGRASGSPR